MDEIEITEGGSGDFEIRLNAFHLEAANGLNSAFKRCEWRLQIIQFRVTFS